MIASVAFRTKMISRADGALRRRAPSRGRPRGPSSPARRARRHCGARSRTTSRRSHASHRASAAASGSSRRSRERERLPVRELVENRKVRAKLVRVEPRLSLNSHGTTVASPLPRGTGPLGSDACQDGFARASRPARLYRDLVRVLRRAPGATSRASMVGYGVDPEIFIWSFAWWPHAILDGLIRSSRTRSGRRTASTSPGRRACPGSRLPSRR